MAAEAGLPPTSATYYFATIDDLLIAALTWSADDWAEQVRQVPTGGEGGIPRLAVFLADMVRRHRPRIVAEYELYLLAARRPALRPAARRWIELATGIAREHTVDPVRTRAAVAAVDGLLLQALLTETPPTAADFQAVLETLLPR